MERLTIGEVAKQGGVNLETVRYYERQGLLPKPPRSASGYRLFPPDGVRRIDASRQMILSGVVGVEETYLNFVQNE